MPPSSHLKGRTFAHAPLPMQMCKPDATYHPDIPLEVHCALIEDEFKVSRALVFVCKEHFLVP